MNLVIMLIITMLCLSQVEAADYLRHEKFSFTPDGREVRTSRPLDPSRKYRLDITSAFTLRPMLACSDKPMLIFLNSHVCWPDLLINGEEVTNSTHMHEKNLDMYFWDDRTTNYYRPKLTVFLWGDGRRLTLSTGRDYTEAIPEASLEIHDPVFRESEQLLAEHREQELSRIEEQRRQEQSRIEEQRRQELRRQQELEEMLIQKEKNRQAERQLEMKREHERIEAEKRSKKIQATLKLLAAIAILLIIFVIGIFIATADRRRHNRLIRERARRRASVQQDRQKSRERAYQHLAQEEAALHAEKQRQRIEAERLEQAAEKARLDYMEHLQKFSEQMIKLALEFEDRPHLEDQSWLESYALQYGSDLRKNRLEIEREHSNFHRDRDFIAYLQERAPHLYRRSTWRMRALAKAEELDVGHKKQPLTPEERAERVERFRARILAKIDMKAKDRIEQVKLITTKAAEYRKELQDLGLDEDEIDEKVSTFVEILTNEAEAVNQPATANIT